MSQMENLNKSLQDHVHELQQEVDSLTQRLEKSDESRIQMKNIGIQNSDRLIKLEEELFES